MQQTELALFELPAPASAAPRVRVPLPLGELPVSCVPAAYDREHLYSPRAGTAEWVEHRPGDVFGPLPLAPSAPKAFAAWWKGVASVPTPDFLGLVAGDEITIQHVGQVGPGTVHSTRRFGAVVRCPVPPGGDRPYIQQFVKSRNQYGHWY
ncbi:hypothetical protein [Streptomyces sp. NPDC047315]|uniref:hypothetical protein n=1 Tax=Streptomyces sp. NPDC047315 TaxID=3155142 RepID=UPI0033E352AF